MNRLIPLGRRNGKGSFGRISYWLQMRQRLEGEPGVIREHIPISRRTVVRKVLQKFPYYEQQRLLELFSCIDAVIQAQSRPYRKV